MITILISGLIMTIIAILFGNGARRIDQVFKLKKGKHYASGFFNRVPRLFINNGNKTLKFILTLDRDCIYDFGNVDNYDINKIAGFSYGLNHHKNSIRIGWSCVNKQIRLHAYWYDNGVRHYKYIMDADPDVPYYVTIKQTKSLYGIYVDDMFVHIPTNKKGRSRLSYYLKSYFGGNNPAPHNMVLEIQEL